MSGYRVTVALVLVAAATYFWLRSPEPEAPKPVPPPPVAAPPTALPSFAPKRLDKPGRPVKAVPSPNEEAYKKFVPYEIVDGVAVGYGDVILGTVDDDAPARGLTEVGPIRLWDEREIPYGIAVGLSNPNRVRDAIRYLTKVTGLTFVPLTDQPDGIVFEPGKENCLSALGKTGGRQPIKLADDCGRTEILHEILHALGFLHEHSRPDRDQYVEVVWDNVDDRYKDQFRAAPASLEDPSRGTPFDFESVMLYPSNLFGKTKGLVTLRRKDGELLNPVRDRLSAGDIRRVREVYR